MRKYWKWILVVIALLLTGVLIWFIFFYNSTPCFSDQEKKKIEEVYYERWIPIPDKPELYPLIWYDENGGVEEDGVWRYIGTYGDCYAFLVIGDNQTGMTSLEHMYVDLPYLLPGLTSDVYYPIEADIVLYHTQKEFTYKAEYSNWEYTSRMDPLALIISRGNREEWISDKQLERLTKDIEEIAKAHN